MTGVSPQPSPVARPVVKSAKANARWQMAFEGQKARRSMPTLIRLIVSLMAWLLFGFIGAGIFYACESSHEQSEAAKLAYTEEQAGLRSSDWRAPQDDGKAGCKGHFPFCAKYDSEGACNAAVVPFAPTDDNKCCWSTGGNCGGSSGGSGAGGSGGGGSAPRPGEGPPPGGTPPPGGNRQLQESTCASKLEPLKQIITSLRAECKQAPPAVETPNWTFAGSLFFAFQVMTTIGYGTFAPATDSGRVAAVLFGSVGIAVTGYALGIFTAAVDARLDALHVRWLLVRHGKRYLIRFKALATTVLLVGYLLLVAAVACALQQGAWSFGASVYFVFVTISTVGLGDLTLPGSSIGTVLLQFLLFFPGLALFSEFIALGNEYSRMADEQARNALDSLASFSTSSLRAPELRSKTHAKPQAYAPSQSP
jgi:hypothetical protein